MEQPTNPFKELLKMQQRHLRAKCVEGDYYDENNILHCGKCGTPKETMLDLWELETLRNGNKNMFRGYEPRFVVRPIPCEHERKAMEAEEERLKKEKINRESDLNKARCFDFDGFKDVYFANDDKRDKEASRIATSFVANFEDVKKKGQGMIFSGGTGSGKTFMAAIVANELLNKGYRVKFTRLQILNQKMMEDYGRAKSPIMDYLETCDLVILDDFGTEKSTSAANENYFMIVDCLSRKRIPIIVTTNMNGAQMASDEEYSHKRIYSRILERCKPVKFKNPDSRTKDVEEWVF